ncbi:adenomatous polyposis coli homolog [Coccinella septempunctata]|uniref:adenomatous polyposis coli homolog n=1 Tax=Coccinella septempunctata TaxID=41139 RepID=UPI001D075E4F|nr:adenomatous polyposis coli homolog [Coccinella septempunctata]
MSLPVSQYEALLAQVRGLRRQAQHVQQLVDPLLFGDASLPQDQNVKEDQIHRTMDVPGKNSIHAETSDDESLAAHSAHHSVSSEPICQKSRGSSSLYHGTWPVEGTMWNSEPATLTIKQPPSHRQMEMPSVMSFASSSGAPMERVLITTEKSMRSSQQLEAKVDMVYSLLAMLGGQEHADMGETLFALSTNPESCLAMRESGCIPLLVQLVQSDRDSETRKKATQALHNLVHSQTDEKLRKREIRIFKLLETVCAYNEALINDVEFVCENLSDDGDRHPVQTIAHLMKLSFDEGHRQAICQLGGIHTIAKLVEAEHSTHGSISDDTHCIMMRRYACMALTNLTFGDSGNKALLCSYRDFMKALVVQLRNPCDELRQVTASVLRNLSWRADTSSKEILREIGSVKALMKSAMLDNKENTLKSILSALWNLSAHCTENKSEICAVKGALEFLIQMLLYKSAPKSLAIIENAGGILRNISSQIAVRDDYREILREHNCLQILLDQLKSPSLTIVSNACGTLWNLSAKNATDQELLWQLGAPTMLKSLNHSKHKMIAMGSSAALKNLLTAKPGYALVQQMDSTALSLDLPELPTLGVRKQKALLKGLDQSLTETFDNLDTPSDKKKVKNEHNQRDIPLNSKSTLDESFSTSYASLNINDSHVNVSCEKKSRIPQSSGSSSLPYAISDIKNPCTSTPIKTKNSDHIEGETLGKRIPKKHTVTTNKFTDSKMSKITKMERRNPLNGIENDSEKSREICLEYSEKESHLNKSGNVAHSGVSNKIQHTEDIDNDKHKMKRNNKEIVANMDEKDHCSTEDISDSEIQPRSSTSKIEFTSLQNELTCNENTNLKDNDIENVNGAISLPPFSNDDISSAMKENISSLPVHKMQPSPRPRKFASLEKPQPIPRSIPQPKTGNNSFESNVDDTNVMSDASTDIRPNILNQEESIEDNIEFLDDLSEKQDTGREKKSNTDYSEKKEISGTPSLDTMKSSLASCKSPQKRFSRNSGIPMSRLPSRVSPMKSVTKNETSNMNFETNESLIGCKIPKDVDEIDKPVSTRQISNATHVKTAEANGPTCSEQESNMRTEGTSEAAEVLNKDLSGKYDDLLFERRKTFSSVADPDDYRFSISKESEITINQLSLSPNNKDEETSRIFVEDITDETSVGSTSSFPRHISVGYASEPQEHSIESSELDTKVARNDAQDKLFLGFVSIGESVIDDNLSTNVKKSESNKSLGKILDASPEFLYSPGNSCMAFSDKKDERLEMSCNDSANVDIRMLDPDAMIESLDRFTAELVSQASSHLQNKDSLYKSSNNDNTWDENSSPNEATFPSISVSAPNVVSFNSESETNTSSKKNDLNCTNEVEQVEIVSNDFSSLNTTTMTDSTLIAMEATKIAEAFKEEADMSSSVNSLVSFEIDQVQPPSHLNSLSNSMIGFLDSKPGSPKMTRKKSLPSNIMVKRALNHSLSHNPSVDNLNHQMTFKEEMNSVNQGGTNRSIPTHSNDISDSKKAFIINGPIHMYSNRNVSSKMPSGFLNLDSSSQLLSVTVTDLCNSLADVATTSIGTETEMFEDCLTHVTENHLQTENDATEFSDANSITPIQSSASSSEDTPKRQKSLNKSLTSKQKRALAKERYKTYIIAAEMVMKDSIINQEENSNEVPNGFPVVRGEITTDETKFASQNVDSVNAPQAFVTDSTSSKLSPKERRLSERSRFQTQVLEVSQIPNFHNLNMQQQQKESESDSSKEPSPAKSKISIRKNILQRRLTNKERFKTQTLEDSQALSNLLARECAIADDTEMHLMVEKEANKVVRTLKDAQTNLDEILDCETISLVSNDDESEPNSGSSVNYRTYHKSWGLRNNIPVIAPNEPQKPEQDKLGDSLENCSITSDDEVIRDPPKPKIVKPDEKKVQELRNEADEQPKGIRGRRKALYSKSNLNKVTPKSIKPVKNVTSNLVKNVTSTLKTTTPKPIQSKPSRIASRPPTKGKATNPTSRPVSGSGVSQMTTISPVLQKNTKPSNSRPAIDCKKNPPKPLERQGTFTKDDLPANNNQSKGKNPDVTRIPVPGSIKSSIPKMSMKQSNIPRSAGFKSASSDRNSKPSNIKIYNRSTSADSRENTFSRRIQSSLSSHSLKSEPEKVQQSGAIKKTIQYQRSDSNTSLNGSNSTKKQVTSKIASIWKKIEESKKKTVTKKDSKKWIEAEVEPSSKASNSNAVPSEEESNTPKRISRLGSFVGLDDNEDNLRGQEVN